MEDVFESLAVIPDPLLVVHYAGDAATRLSEVHRFIDASASLDKELVLVRHADHWGFVITGPHQRGGRTTEGTDAVVSWMQSRFPLNS